jgi:hypothetical protein
MKERHFHDSRLVAPVDEPQAAPRKVLEDHLIVLIEWILKEVNKEGSHDPKLDS